MALKYDPYGRVSSILNLKGEWDAADREKNDWAKQRIQDKASALYKDLGENGYGDLANNLYNSNYAQAQGVVNNFKGQGKAGKVAGRSRIVDRLTGLWGLTEDEANDLINWDPDSGDVYLGKNKSVNVGPGDVLIDGTNYYSDPAALDSAVDAYAQNAGLKKSEDLMYNQNTYEAQNKLNQLWGMQVDSQDVFTGDPMETSWGKGIMDMYLNKGDMAGYNEIAQGIGQNGGNVDSYSQANALRQLKAFKDSGTQAVINQWNSLRQGLLDYWGGSLSDTIDRQTGLAQQIHDNEYADRQQYADITGYLPPEEYNRIMYKENKYLLPDGTFNPEYDGKNFAAEIETALAAGDTITAGQLSIGRDAKIKWDQDRYGQYAGDGKSYIPAVIETAKMRDNQRDRKSTERIEEGKNETDKYTAGLAADTTKYGYDTEIKKQELLNKGQLDVTNAESAGALAVARENNASDERINTANNETKERMNSANNTTNKEITQIEAGNSSGGNTTTKNTGKTGQTSAPMSDSQVEKWANTLNGLIRDEFGDGYAALRKVGYNKYEPASAGSEYIIDQVLNSNSLTEEQKEYLLLECFNVSPGSIDTYMRDHHYRR